MFKGWGIFGLVILLFVFCTIPTTGLPIARAGLNFDDKNADVGVTGYIPLSGWIFSYIVNPKNKQETIFSWIDVASNPDDQDRGIKIIGDYKIVALPLSENKAFEALISKAKNGDEIPLLTYCRDSSAWKEFLPFEALESLEKEKVVVKGQEITQVEYRNFGGGVDGTYYRLSGYAESTSNPPKALSCGLLPLKPPRVTDDGRTRITFKAFDADTGKELNAEVKIESTKVPEINAILEKDPTPVTIETDPNDPVNQVNYNSTISLDPLYKPLKTKLTLDVGNEIVARLALKTSRKSSTVTADPDDTRATGGIAPPTSVSDVSKLNYCGGYLGLQSPFKFWYIVPTGFQNPFLFEPGKYFACQLTNTIQTMVNYVTKVVDNVPL
jgi:hypothetical protein